MFLEEYNNPDNYKPENPSQTDYVKMTNMKEISVFINLTEEETKSLKECILKDRELLKYRNLDGVTLLQIAIIHNNSNLGKFLIDNNINVNVQDENGNTALHYCAEYNRYEIAIEILNHSGDLSLADKYGNQPLWTAVSNDKGKNNRIEIIKLFLDFGANKQHENNINKTPENISSRYKELSELFSQYK